MLSMESSRTLGSNDVGTLRADPLQACALVRERERERERESGKKCSS